VRCPYPGCNKTFAKNRMYNLKAHLRSHSQVKPFQCLSCSRAFSRKHDLERHSRTHTGDKPYICEACGSGFPRSDALRRH
ncbi:A designed zinc finger protein bound To Dna, partial [Tilletiaria anomala UBC 951]